MVSFGIRGDTIMWFYSDHDGESREHLIVAKLDDPNGAATRHFGLNWDIEDLLVTLGDTTYTLLRFQGRPAVSRFEVLTANAFIRYDKAAVHLCHISHLSSGIQPRGGNDKPQIPSITWSSHGSHGFGGYAGLHYDRTDAVLPRFYLHNNGYSSVLGFEVDTLAGAEHDLHVVYPVVPKRTNTSANDNPNDGVIFRWSEGRKAARIGFDSSGEELRLNTEFIDDPNQCGHLCIALRQYGLSGIGEELVAMECDEVTGRILLVIGDGGPDTRLFLADLSQP